MLLFLFEKIDQNISIDTIQIQNTGYIDIPCTKLRIAGNTVQASQVDIDKLYNSSNRSTNNNSCVIGQQWKDLLKRILFRPTMDMI